MENNKSSFLDFKSLIAIVFVAGSWFAWDGYMKTKYPHLYENKSAEVTSTTSAEGVTKSVENTTAPITSKSASGNTEVNAEAPQVKQLEEKLISFESPILKFDISSKGMGFKNIVFKNYLEKDKKTQKQFKSGLKNLPFSTGILRENGILNFDIKKLSDNRFEGTAYHNGVVVSKTIDIDPSNYNFKVKVVSSNLGRSFPGVKFFLSNIKDEAAETSIFMPMMGGQEVFVKYENTDERVPTNEFPDAKINVKNSTMAHFGETYFAQALLNKSNTMPAFTATMVDKEIIGQLLYPVLNANDGKQELYLNGYLGPKDVNFLGTVNNEFTTVIDYGWFDFIARILLKTLKFLNSIIGNWGVAIIVMTLLVKFILLPLNVVAFRSMKKMQKIQPQIKSIKEKYKDNPQEMNMRVMSLMKEQKANPVSGCLPTFLQFPIFFALYRVLGQSIELYQAPFAFWIQDLSLKDPFYILPVLMGIAMFFQMKISPSTMDPMQKKIMMFMPVVFSLFMLALPSGLTLYIFVSTLFGIIQHFILMREPSDNKVLSKAHN